MEVMGFQCFCKVVGRERYAASAIALAVRACARGYHTYHCYAESITCAAEWCTRVAFDLASCCCDLCSEIGHQEPSCGHSKDISQVNLSAQDDQVVRLFCKKHYPNHRRRCLN